MPYLDDKEIVEAMRDSSPINLEADPCPETFVVVERRSNDRIQFRP